MSSDEYDVEDAPFPILRGVFEDVQEVNSIGINDLQDFISTIALQAVADGRVNVLINKQVVFCSLHQMSNAFLSHFQKFKIPILMTINDKTTIVSSQNQVVVPKSVPSVSFSLIGSLNASVTFQYISANSNINDSFHQYPLVCIGLNVPQEDQTLIQEFSNYLQNRTFPVFAYDGLVKKRTKLERRNREFLIQTSKTRANMVERYNNSSTILKKRQKQLELLEEKISSLTNSNKLRPPSLDEISEVIEKLDTSINIIVETTDQLSEEIDAKAKGKQMTRREELELLQTLGQQVRDSRQQLEILKEQASH